MEFCTLHQPCCNSVMLLTQVILCVIMSVSTARRKKKKKYIIFHVQSNYICYNDVIMCNISCVWGK